ncbi:Mis18-binding protein 1 [Larimichthys crocea]|uniref:Uncharacterized protein n=1 Tax=Larimichthys crocea TaxID=215358 RepID=A0ACD3RRJ9_LARCR|nr:Mis18-binding protein 1 [Larimichthys crocea]
MEQSSGRPGRHSESTWTDEAQALTLSPISSPQKTFGYADISSTQRQRKGAFLESTAVSQLSFLVNRKQIHTDPPQFRDMGGFNASSRTPVKIQPVNNDSVGGEFEEASPAFRFSPMKKKLRKRKCEPLEVNMVSSSTKEFSNEATSQAREMETSSAFREDDTHIEACMEDLGPVRGFSAEPSEMNPPPRSIAMKYCRLIMERLPLMSPAKMFAYMKERENKSEQQDVQKVSSSTRDLFGDDVNPSRDTPPSTYHSTGETEDVTPSVSQSVGPATQSGVDSADSQSYTDPSEDTLIPAVQAQPILLEDPLVLNSPRVSIPKKNDAVFKRNKWPQRKFPSESVVYLKKWFLRRGPTGLFVDGIHREDNIPWNSNIIVERFSNYVLKTVTGKVYILVGKMNLGVDSGLPKWFLKKFVNGFPPNWKELYEKFLSESREGQGRETKMNSEAKDIKAKTKSEASSMNISMKRHNQKTFMTPDFCPPPSLSSAKVSRSGRVIKPPLEYWKGGRVTLDADMNVTVHESYDTTICNPEVTTQVSARASQKPARVFLPCSEGRKQCEPSSDEQASAPVRKVKAPVHKRNRVKAKPDDKPTYSPEPTVETLSSPEEWSDRRTRSRQRCPGPERTFYVDTAPQKQNKPEKSSTQRSKKQTHDTTRPSARVSRSKRAITSSPESPSVNDKISEQLSSDEDFSIVRKTQGKSLHRKRGEKSQPKHKSPPSESEGSGKELRMQSRRTKNGDAAKTQTKHTESKCAKTSQPEKPKSKSSKKHKADKDKNKLIPQEQAEDKWTETELVKLQEAVSFYPKNIAGYWAKVAMVVGTRSAEECHNQHTAQGSSEASDHKSQETQKEQGGSTEKHRDLTTCNLPLVTDHPVISARVGTLKRKQQVREFLETMPKENVDDVFSSAYMQNKRFEIPSMCPSEDQDFSLSDMEPLTPMSTRFPEIKTPQCLHITPGMMGSPNRTSHPTPSVKRTMQRCVNTENDAFVVWEMFPGKDGALSESGEEDFYFSDND